MGVAIVPGWPRKLYTIIYTPRTTFSNANDMRAQVQKYLNLRAGKPNSKTKYIS